MSKKKKTVEGEVVDSTEQVEDKPKRGRPKGSTAVVKSDNTAISLINEISGKELEEALKQQTEKRKLIKEFVQKNLVDGTDYGVIKGQASGGRTFESGRTLLKPGQEKIFSLFSLTARLSKDTEVLEMLGEQDAKGLIAYKCDVYRGDQWVAEGHGACNIKDKRDANSAIKIAAKRARMDACLALGFSEYFNQDLDDPEYRKIAEQEAKNRAEQYERANPFGLDVRDRKEPADDEEKKVLIKLLVRRDIKSKEQQLAAMVLNGIDDPKIMTSGEIREFINKVKNNNFEMPPAKQDKVIEDLSDDPINLNDLPDLDNEDDKKPTPKSDPDEPELVVDDQLKNELMNEINNMGFNKNGQMWLMKKIAGKPFGRFEDLDESEWRRAFAVVEDIRDGAIEVADHHAAGFVGPAADPSPTDYSEPTPKEEPPIPDQLAATFPGAKVLNDKGGDDAKQ